MESFILQDYIDTDICDNIVKSWEDNSSNSSFDKMRGYWRLNDKQLDQEIIRKYIGQVTQIEKKYRDKFSFINQSGEWGLMSP